jgi:hypothetical protein
MDTWSGAKIPRVPKALEVDFMEDTQPKNKDIEASKKAEEADRLLEDILHRIRAIRFCVECMVQRTIHK